jgi:NAD(P)-dependent dehydrogenase (short-subunit alcohol dehydrogenase family)
MKLSGKVAVITGAASGIGRATALRFAQEGASVVVADINGAGGEETVALAQTDRGTAAFIQTDVGQEEAIRAMIAFAVERYGGLDILYNNAYWTLAQYAEETTADNWQKTIDVTLRAVWLGAKYAIPHLRARGGGVILNTASVQSLVGIPGYAAYQAAKGGVLSLTRALALELAPDNIRVVAILPGAIDTPAVRISQDIDVSQFEQTIPMKRLGRPAEIAATAAFLASDDASYITGVPILVDGGYSVP